MKHLKTNTFVYSLIIFIASTLPTSAEPILIQESWLGPHSRVTKDGCFQITTESAWNDLWEQHANNLQKPSIDFDTNTVVAVFEGKSLNSEGVFATEPEDQPKGTQTLYIMSRSYQTMGVNGGGVDVTPYGIFVVPGGIVYKVMRGHQNGIGGQITWHKLDCTNYDKQN